MDLRSELPPPEFYLWRGQQSTGQHRYFLFTDVNYLPTSYSTTPNEQPLGGRYSPYISEGSGGGFRFTVQGKLSVQHEFTTLGEVPQGSARSGGFPDGSRLVYEDLKVLEDIIREDGPTPRFIFSRPDREPMTVVLLNMESQVKLNEFVNTDRYTDYPTSIPVTMQFLERVDYYIRVGRG